jgi:chemotaxis protein MotB
MIAARSAELARDCALIHGPTSFQRFGTSTALWARMRHQNLLTYAFFLTATGCVSAGKYDAAVADATKTRAALASKQQEASRLAASERNAQLRAGVLTSDRNDARASLFGCQKDLDDATAVNQELHAELARLGKDADQLLAAKGALASSLDQAKARLEELRRAQAAAEARSALFRDLALKLKHMIDAGDLQITLRSGRMVLILPNDVLFDSGRANLKPTGKEALEQIASALGTIQGRRFQVSRPYRQRADSLLRVQLELAAVE